MVRPEKRKAPSKVVGVRISDQDYWMLKAVAVERKMRLGALVLEGVRQVLKQKAQAA